MLGTRKRMETFKTFVLCKPSAERKSRCPDTGLDGQSRPPKSAKRTGTRNKMALSSFTTTTSAVPVCSGCSGSAKRKENATALHPKLLWLLAVVFAARPAIHTYSEVVKAYSFN